MLPAPVPESGPLSAKDLDTLWHAWSGTNEISRDFSGKAFKLRTGQAVDLLKTKLIPVPESRVARAAELIKQLDDDNVDIRDKASKELGLDAHPIEPLILSAFAASKPGEVRNRLTIVKNAIAASPRSTDLILQLRGIALLEYVGGSAAEVELKRLATGAAGTRVTEEALAAVKRMEVKK